MLFDEFSKQKKDKAGLKKKNFIKVSIVKSGINTMGLEIAISVRSGRTDGQIKKRGDILVAKLEGSPWGSEELKKQAIVRLSDEVIASMDEGVFKTLMERTRLKLQQMAAAGEPYPVVILPTSQRATHSSDRSQPGSG